MSAIEGLRGIRTDRRHRDHGWKDTRPSPSLGTAHLSASKTGLVLVGGGARGAYQAGVLQGLAEIVGERFGDRPPFDVVTGISAGAINAAYLASRADRMAEASAGLAALWGELRIDRVMRTDAVSLFSIGTRWLRDLTLGGLLKPDARSNHLLDTTPLREFLIANIDFEAIARHIASDKRMRSKPSFRRVRRRARQPLAGVTPRSGGASFPRSYAVAARAAEEIRPAAP